MKGPGTIRVLVVLPMTVLMLLESTSSIIQTPKAAISLISSPNKSAYWFDAVQILLSAHLLGAMRGSRLFPVRRCWAGVLTGCMSTALAEY